MAQIELRYATIRFQDGGTPQQHINVKVGEGNMTYTETKNREYVLDKGNLDSVRNGDQVPMDVTLDFTWEFITGGADTDDVPTVEDVLKQRGGAADWETSSDDACEPYALDLFVNYDPDCSTEEREELTFSDFRYNTLGHDLSAGQIAIAGQCNAEEPTAVRQTQT